MSSSLFRRIANMLYTSTEQSGINSSRIQLAGRQIRSINKRNTARASTDSSTASFHFLRKPPSSPRLLSSDIENFVLLPVRRFRVEKSRVVLDYIIEKFHI